MRRVAPGVAGLLAAGFLACAPEPHPPASPPPGPRIDYAGCATVVEGPVCVLRSSRRLRIWIEDVGTALRPAGDGVEIAAGDAVAGGTRFEIEVPESTRTVAVYRPGSRESLWSLALALPEERGWVERFRELARGGNLDAAAAVAREATRSPDPAERAVAHSWLRRLSYRAGNEEAFADHARAAARAHRQAGRLQDEVDEVTALAFQLLEDGRFAEARQELDRLEAAPGESAEMAVRRAYFSGLWAEQVGDARTALAALTEAASRAEAVGLDGEHRAALQVLARELQRLGRLDESAATFARLAGMPVDDACEQARIAVNQGWTWWLIRDAGGSAPDPIPRFREALEGFLDPGSACPRAEAEVRNLWLNLALAHMEQGAAAAARDALTQVGSLGGRASPGLELWRLDLDGRLALAEGRPVEALGRYEDLARRADALALPEARWRAHLGRARAWRARGDSGRALAELEAAEELLDRESLQVPLGEGRAGFAGTRAPGTRLLIELLLADGRPREAFDAVRRSRSRVLRGLRRQDRLAALEPADRIRWAGHMEDRSRLRTQLDALAADWTRPADELARVERQRAELRRDLTRTLDQAFALLGDESSRELPRLWDRELVLAAHPVTRGWVAFGARNDRVVAHSMPSPETLLDDPEELAAAWLGPFAEILDGAVALRVLPYGELRGVDVHALPWRGETVLDHVPVVYGLDVSVDPLARTKMPALGGSFRALVVADPQGNLPEARREVEIVAAAFAGEDVLRLQGRAATGATVRRELPEVDLFHYAGHARFRGLGGWESALLLADGGRLTVGDVLALPKLPRWVVLSGCETARADEASPVETLGLAQAFAAAGSMGVVAAVRPVEDAAAAELVEAFYALWERETRPAAALRRAQLTVRRNHPESDWAAFRLVRP